MRLCTESIDHCEVCPIYPKNCERWNHRLQQAMNEEKTNEYTYGILIDGTILDRTYGDCKPFTSIRETEEYAYRRFGGNYTLVVFKDGDIEIIE